MMFEITWLGFDEKRLAAAARSTVSRVYDFDSGSNFQQKKSVGVLSLSRGGAERRT